MADVLHFITASLCAVLGMTWLAVAMRPHWRQVCGARPRAVRTPTKLRACGATALFASLLAYLHHDHVSIAVVVWVMTLSLSALLVAFALAWRPQWLAWLVRSGGRYDDYLRQEIAYFDVASDPRHADFSDLVVRQPTSSGGAVHGYRSAQPPIECRCGITLVYRCARRCRGDRPQAFDSDDSAGAQVTLSRHQP